MTWWIDSLPRRGQPFAVIQRQCLAAVENRQIVAGVAGQPNHIAHRQQGAAAGESLSGSGFQFGQRGGHDDRRG
ncbi:hypothetical protein MKAN_13645 [Mycobacterium kansasii ATCC 12478]|uniref:Uncharacterized protein n=1 Tax=Mycobacterium kansasii ATCC 12478 TaxID=557599 RepID=U5X229_MYCKA|nr:hypothetical protein MKAN_13645 [Mycobacterium kansasii ATCC 12478]